MTRDDPATPAAAPTVAGLVAQARDGDREAFGDLVRRYQDYAYGVAAGLLGDPELGRDVVQEAFVTAYCELARLHEPERFGGWLHGIVRHTAFRALRELQRLRRLREEVSKPGCEPPPVASADEDLLAAERRRIVRLAMARLSDRHREVVGLHYMDGLSYTQIAGFLEVTETTVQGRLQRARAQLREELKMVEETYTGQRLPEDFAAEVDRLLRSVAGDGEAEKRRTAQRLAEIGVPAVDPLCEALGDSTGAVRQVALWALCHIGDERACGPVLRLLYARNPWKAWRVSAQSGLMSIPGVREALIKQVQEGRGGPSPWKTVGDPPHMAVHVLSMVEGDAEIQQLLEDVFRDQGYRTPIRQAAIMGLCRLQPDRAEEWVVEAQRTDDRQMRRMVAWHALSRGILPPLEACLEAFRAANFPQERSHVARLILRHGDAGLRALREIADTGQGATAWAAALAVAGAGDAEVLERLRGELARNESANRARDAAAVLAAQAAADVQAWVEDGGAPVESLPTLMWALARRRHHADSDAMEDLASEGTPAVRAAAVRMLTRARGADNLPQLRRALAEGRPRKVAQEAFRQMQHLGAAAEPVARDMLTSNRWTERKAGVCLLRRWGRLTESERQRCLVDEHVAVRQGAGEPRR